MKRLWSTVSKGDKIGGAKGPGSAAIWLALAAQEFSRRLVTQVHLKNCHLTFFVTVQNTSGRGEQLVEAGIKMAQGQTER